MLGQLSREIKWVLSTESNGELGTKDSPMMMQFLQNNYPSDQTYLESIEDGCHDCEVGPQHETEKMKNSDKDLKWLQVWS